MEINRKFFPKILTENELTYFSYFIAVVESIDELSSIEITKMPEYYKFRIAPSHPQYIKGLLEEILKIHNQLRITLILSKSIKTSKTINFKILL